MCSRLRISKVLFILTKCVGCEGLLGGVWGVDVCPHRASRWNNKSRQRRPPLHGPSPSCHFHRFFSWHAFRSTVDQSGLPLLLQSLHPSIPYSHIHQNDACPSTYRSDRLARLARARMANAGPRRAPSQPIPHLRLLASSNGAVITVPRPSVINSHYDGYGGIRTLSVSNERWWQEKVVLIVFLTPPSVSFQTLVYILRNSSQCFKHGAYFAK